MNKIISLFILLVLIGAGVYIVASDRGGQPVPVPSPTPSQSQRQGFDARNATFTIDGKQVMLVDGVSEVPMPNSAANITTRYFGNEAVGDLNGDGLEDAAFLITQETGGSGLFYYAVVALKTADGYKTTNAFFIGDRIAPQPTEIHSQTGELRVNYAKRKASEPMTAQPSIGAVTLLKVTPQGVLEGLMK